MSSENRVFEVNGHPIEIYSIPGFSEVDISPSLTRKLIPREELSDLGDFLRRRGSSIAFTTGVFDMIHIGHVRYLQLARSLGDVLFAGVNTDNSVRHLKGEGRPILDQNVRAEMLSYLGIVDYISYFDEPTGAESIRILKPNSYLCVEGSWEGDIATKEEVIAMSELGGKVYYTPRQGPTISTSQIIEKIGTGAIEQLAKDLPRIWREYLKFDKK